MKKRSKRLMHFLWNLNILEIIPFCPTLPYFLLPSWYLVYVIALYIYALHLSFSQTENDVWKSTQIMHM